MPAKKFYSELLEYLATERNGSDDPDRIPSLDDLSQKMGISQSKLREQLEAAKTLGLVEARPRTGIRRIPYSFAPAATQSLLYAIATDPGYFRQFADLRIQLEASFWHAAVDRLTLEDRDRLQNLLNRALEKLNGDPITIPHGEHRELHMAIFSRLDNPFVLGLLEAYWTAYEAVELNSYADLAYLREVWEYHGRIVEAIRSGDSRLGLEIYLDHTRLLRIRK